MSKLKYLLIFIIIIVFLLYLMNQLLNTSANDYRNSYYPIAVKSFISSIGHQLSSHMNNKVGSSSDVVSGQREGNVDRVDKEYRILLWTQYFGTDSWSGLRLDSMNCTYANCILTADKEQLDTSDVVLFHWRDIYVRYLPKHHNPDQIWVLFNWESPYYTPEYSVRPLIGQINWTMSYRRDSDIYVPYGAVVACDQKWRNEDLFDRKTKNIAWIVSNCLSESNRELFAKELKEHIDIDVYGYCGQYYCTRDQTCLKMIEQKYKFYLSFENSLCKDYVTEKLFRTLEYDIIPIVYGSADYKQIMPNNSYINILDFGSAKELADYLRVVANDKQKYNSYMNWKNNYCVKQTNYKYFCDLCQKINMNSNEKNNKSIKTNNRSDLIQWWFRDANCQHRNNSTYSRIKTSMKPIYLLFICIYILIYTFA